MSTSDSHDSLVKSREFQGEDGDEQGPGRPLGSTRGAAMRPFVAPGASDGLSLPLLEGLGAVLPPLPPLPPDQRLLPPHPPTQIADIWSRSESQPVAPVPAPTPAPKRVCHMCGAEKQCKYKLSDQLIKTFSAALVNGSEACAHEPYMQPGALVCQSCYDVALDTRAVCDALSPFRLPPPLLEMDSEIKKLKRKVAAMSARALSTKMRADGSRSVVECVRRKRRDSLAVRRSTLSRRESFTGGGDAMLDKVTSPSHAHATPNICRLRQI